MVSNELAPGQRRGDEIAAERIKTVLQPAAGQPDGRCHNEKNRCTKTPSPPLCFIFLVHLLVEQKIEDFILIEQGILAVFEFIVLHER